MWYTLFFVIYFNTIFSTKISTGCLWIEIAFDLSVFGLTLARTLRAVADDEALGLVRTVFRDGILYFLVIFSTNLVWALMVIFAPVSFLRFLFHKQFTNHWSRA